MASAFDVFLDNMFTIVASLAVAFIVPKVMGLIAKLAEKYHLQASIVSQQQVEAFVMQQILRVKEEAAAAIKAKVKPLEAEEKLASVVEAVVNKFPGIDDEEAADLTKALLASVGEGATQLSQAALNDAMSGMFGMGSTPGAPIRPQ